MNDEAPAAIYSKPEAGLVKVCAWHDEHTPGSVAIATAWAKVRGLTISHGVCPCCLPRVAEAMRREVSTLIA